MPCLWAGDLFPGDLFAGDFVVDLFDFGVLVPDTEPVGRDTAVPDGCCREWMGPPMLYLIVAPLPISWASEN